MFFLDAMRELLKRDEDILKWVKNFIQSWTGSK
jgi:hypothetical protein